MSKFLMYMNELNKHKKIIENIFETIERTYGMPIKETDVEDLVNINIILLDSLEYRFSKFQDTLGKAIKVWFYLKGENVDNLTIIDIINLAEKIGFSINKEIWWRCRSIRNRISHQYEEDYSKITLVVNDIYELFPLLKKVLKELEDRK
ncbi:hypothetical protein [Caminibacter mediatlanticus]|uniref:Uncharacterized protein n=1 Tax=Caminibacter mediatlanticus TB-2 TaxID=391592 RepID=A0AAI9F2S4_9BACT|nr:hypothetical protein [Caminibacter mediatlanticus]EDM24065.1 hypothetical protein CMTB2_07416 [Caminibacter mediatlanticus TB-2]